MFDHRPLMMKTTLKKLIIRELTFFQIVFLCQVTRKEEGPIPIAFRGNKPFLFRKMKEEQNS